MNVATMQRRIEKLEKLRSVGSVGAIMEQGGDHAYLDTGERVSLEELERLAAAGRISCIREYPACYLSI